MSFFDIIKKIIVFEEPEEGNTFVLAEKPHENSDKEKKTLGEEESDRKYTDEIRKETSSSEQRNNQNEESAEAPNLKNATIIKRKKRTSIVNKSNKSESKDAESSVNDIVNGTDFKNVSISPDINVNRKIIESIFSFPENSDLIFREFDIRMETSYKAAVVFMNSMTDKDTLHKTVINPLMHYGGKNDDKIDIIDYIMGKIIPTNQVVKVQTYGQVIDAILIGKTAILVENSGQILLADTIGWKTRSIERPISEKTVKGPQEAFNENFIMNIGLIRRSLPNHNLLNEIITIGTEQKNTCSVMYMKNITNPSLVKEVKRRLKSIKIDYLLDSTGLEQFIEDHPFISLPQVVNTERPDRVVSALLQGRVAIVLNNSPNVMIVPVTYWSLLHSPEDRYLRFEFGTLLRLIRHLALMITLFLPALYIAVTNFHQEMIPTDLLFAIAGAREKVPFPTIVEVLIMEISFELIREAGIRIPGLIGPTLGIIGALILGQAAVAANIVSPILIIIVALTGIGSFAIPDYSLAFGVRVNRFIYIFLASFMGLYGIAFGAFVMLALLCHVKSFGVPYLAPFAPLTKSAEGAIARPPLWNEERTPDYLNTQRSKRQPNVSRGWIKSKPEGRKE